MEIQSNHHNLEKNMPSDENIVFYDKHQPIIHNLIKSDPATKPIWRKLYWTTGKGSDQYKSGSVNIFRDNFPALYLRLKISSTNREGL